MVMGMTMAEKILAVHSGKDKVVSGEYIYANVDMVMGHDVSIPRAIRIFKEMGAKKVFDKDKVVIIEDHFVPNNNIDTAEQCKLIRQFAVKQDITHYYPVGHGGICHAFLPERGMIHPGELVVAGDSHTTTYGALAALGMGIGATDIAAVMALGRIWLKVPETIKMELEGMPRQ